MNEYQMTIKKEVTIDLHNVPTDVVNLGLFIDTLYEKDPSIQTITISNLVLRNAPKTVEDLLVFDEDIEAFPGLTPSEETID